MSDYFLADDLSGALDAAAAFHAAGQRVTIALSVDAWPANPAAGEVTGVTTETRNAPAGAAAAAVTRAIAQGRARGARLIYKKIDSTLRGPVAAEMAALMQAMPEAQVLFSPANPRVGRIVRDGILCVNGVRVDQSEFAHDPVWPVRESSIRKLLGDLATERVLIADAETEGELAAAVARIASAGEPWVAVGSGALARPVATHWAKRSERGTPPGRARVSGPVLFVCGSAHRANREQAAVLAREFAVPVHDVRIADVAGTVRDARSSFWRRGAAALIIESASTDSTTALHAIASAAQEVIATTGVARVFATGGETAGALCGALGIATLEFIEEIEAGLSLSQAKVAAGPLLLAIKPGGFGDERTWRRAWMALNAAP